jgi:RimJ/RimL family protein N-acetyltransferase
MDGLEGGDVSLLNWPETVPVLTDGRVTLRAWHVSDVDDAFAACQDAELQHAIPVPVPYLADHARGFIEEFAPQQWASRQGAPFAAVDAESRRLLAAPSLKSVDHDRKVAEVGYWVAPWARGQQVAQRAVSLICDWAFTEVGFRRLEFYIEPSNVASCAVAERLGAVREELFPEKEIIRGTPRDIARYALEK